MPDLEHRLRDALRTQANHVEHQLRQPQRLPAAPRRVLRSAVAFVVVAAFVGAVVVVGMWLGGQRTTPAEQPAPAVTEQPPMRCQAPPLRPTYLPWLRPGQPVPSPEQFSIPQAGTSGLIWFEDPQLRFDAGHVRLITLFGPLGGDPEARMVGVRGRPGTLGWIGSPGSGELHVSWRERPGRCGSFNLVLVTKGLSARQAEAEILRVAESLVEP